ncbi:NAD(P)H-binding protein [Hyalangium gracile]|uniref:NAD(P)H-binding protein n=1 Tax=Hyalangium gracile TaxID=394092 RepID=UPI001CCD67AB|nr:NAD(P)H-binding protein [Hyalangium gracile]
MSSQRVLVTGATGNVGRHVVSQLLRTGTAVRALTRNPGSPGLPPGVELVRGDLSAPDSLGSAMNGIDAVFLLWPFFTVDAAPAVLEVIQKHARRIVYLSAASVRDDLEAQPGLFHADMERLIARSGLEWTFLRPTGFATNTLMWAPQIRAGDVVRWPYGAAARSLIHERDIAAAAVHTLTRDGHAGARYVLTGPETLTQVEQVRLIGEAIGRPVRYEELSPEEARRQLLQAWGSPSFVEAALSGWAQMVEEPERSTRTVEELTGAPALAFREWARDHAGDFR